MKYSSRVGSDAFLVPVFGEVPVRHTSKEGARGGDVPAVGMSMASEPAMEEGLSLRQRGTARPRGDQMRRSRGRGLRGGEASVFQVQEDIITPMEGMK